MEKNKVTILLRPLINKKLKDYPILDGHWPLNTWFQKRLQQVRLKTIERKFIEGDKDGE